MQVARVLDAREQAHRVPSVTAAGLLFCRV
jgi:hypothetical protein